MPKINLIQIKIKIMAKNQHSTLNNNTILYNKLILKIGVLQQTSRKCVDIPTNLTPQNASFILCSRTHKIILLKKRKICTKEGRGGNLALKTRTKEK